MSNWAMRKAELPVLQPGMVDKLDSHLVVNMLGRVNPQFQAPVALFYLEDYSYNEIAEVLELPLGTVKSRIARGLHELRGLMIAKSEDAGRGGKGMTRVEAQKVLELYRPVDRDSNDPADA